MTLPRLELMATLVASRLANFVSHALAHVKITKQVIWSDSQIVIHWLLGTKKLPCFVQNRVQEIRKFNGEIKYCPTKDNPADLITRGITTEELTHSTPWWKGPQWLNTGDWPICDLYDTAELHRNEASCNITVDNTHDDVDKPETQNTGIDKIIDINRFSSLLTLLRVTVLVQKFVACLKDSKLKKLDQISASDLDQAETLWIKTMQNASYYSEINSLQCRNGKQATLV